MILTNGARLYVDHAHPEYSSPECTNPLDMVRWDKAGEQGMRDASRVRHRVPGQPEILIYKNNTDDKGASYGAHENCLDAALDNLRGHRPGDHSVLRVPPGGLRRRPGRVCVKTDSEDGFQISQRADYFEVEVGLETTLKRPIVNTRDEPHADPDKYRRLHVIIGDANLAEISTYLKLGTTALVFSMIEHRLITAVLSGSPRSPRRRGLRRSDAPPPARGGGRPQADRDPAAEGIPRPRRA